MIHFMIRCIIALIAMFLLSAQLVEMDVEAKSVPLHLAKHVALCGAGNIAICAPNLASPAQPQHSQFALRAPAVIPAVVPAVIPAVVPAGTPVWSSAWSSALLVLLALGASIAIMRWHGRRYVAQQAAWKQRLLRVAATSQALDTLSLRRMLATRGVTLPVVQAELDASEWLDPRSLAEVSCSVEVAVANHGAWRK